MKRKPRKKRKELKNIDTMKPLQFIDLGTDNDPCFGKHYSIAAAECKRCGERDVCSILSQENIHKSVKAQEKKGRFKDVEEGELVDSQNKTLSKMLLSRAKKKPETWLKLDKLVDKAIEKFNLTEKDGLHVKQRIIKAAQSNKYLKVNKSLTKYRYNG